MLADERGAGKVTLAQGKPLGLTSFPCPCPLELCPLNFVKVYPDSRSSQARALAAPSLPQSSLGQELYFLRHFWPHFKNRKDPSHKKGYYGLILKHMLF